MTAEAPTKSGAVGWLAANRNLAGMMLIVAGIALAVVPVVLIAKYETNWLGTAILTALIALLWLAVGVVLRFRPVQSGSPEDEAHFLALAFGGLTGLGIAVLGLILNFKWWDGLSNWLRLGQRDDAWRVMIALATLLAGLGIMFASVASARSQERSSPVLRRLIYGYNAVLTGILLFMILAVVNVIAYLKLPAMVDSTESGIFALSDRSKQVLRAIDKPVTVYLLMSTQSFAYDEMLTLLKNAQEYAPRMQVESLSTGLNSGTIRDLQKKYPEIVSDGVLIVYGDEGSQRASFIKREDIIRTNFAGGESTESFEGESRLITELSFLSEDKQKPIVYFSQKNAGEFDLTDSNPRSEAGIGALKTRLEKRNFDVRPLTFDVADPKVPDDAAIVVLAGPKQAYSQPIVNALQKYLADRKGKLIGLFDLPADRKAKTMPDTGLEGLFATYKVQLGRERILMVPLQIGQSIIRDPEASLYLVPDSLVNAKNPIALTFRDAPLFLFGARIVKAMPAAGGDAGIRAEVLLETMPRLPVWAEADLQSSPRALAQALMQNPAARAERLSKEPLPTAVIVSESPPPMGGGPAPSKPRMAVFGVANFITNPRIDEQRGQPEYFDLMVSTLDWLRERPANIGVDSRPYKNFVIDPRTDYFRLVWLPLILAIVSIIGLGAGVWIVRRR